VQTGGNLEKEKGEGTEEGMITQGPENEVGNDLANPMTMVFKVHSLAKKEVLKILKKATMEVRVDTQTTAALMMITMDIPQITVLTRGPRTVMILVNGAETETEIVGIGTGKETGMIEKEAETAAGKEIGTEICHDRRRVEKNG